MSNKCDGTSGAHHGGAIGSCTFAAAEMSNKGDGTRGSRLGGASGIGTRLIEKLDSPPEPMLPVKLPSQRCVVSTYQCMDLVTRPVARPVVRRAAEVEVPLLKLAEVMVNGLQHLEETIVQ